MQTSRFIIVASLMAALAGCSSNSDNPMVVQPTPTPTPTPAPTPDPTPTPAALGCAVNPNPDCTAPQGPAGVFGCCQVPRFNDDQFGFAVEFALNTVESERPDLFRGPEGRVSDLAALAEAVCATIEANFAMCCAQQGPHDEIAVKEDNSRSEQYDIMFGDEPGFLRHNGYSAFCVPARF
jgi:hypothetical protein